MDTNEQNLKRAKQTFENAAGCETAKDAICLIGEGLAPLADALIAMNQDLTEIRRELEYIKKLANKRPK